jgi:hypothetical protein
MVEFFEALTITSIKVFQNKRKLNNAKPFGTLDDA